ncbi:MAG: GTP-binding protein [Candidatus Hodarchaeota archaeon]
MNSAPSTSPEALYHKIVFLGNSNVGKTSIIRRILNLEINIEYNPTIGIRIHNLEIKADDPYYLQLWDVSGDESNIEILPSLLKETAVAVITFDHKNKESQVEFKQLYEKVSELISPNQILLVGNKAEDETKEIPKILESWVRNLNLVIIPLSALKNTGHTLLLHNIIEVIKRKPEEQKTK